MSAYYTLFKHDVAINNNNNCWLFFWDVNRQLHSVGLYHKHLVIIKSKWPNIKTKNVLGLLS